LILATIAKAAWLSSTEPEKSKNLYAESTAGDRVSRMIAESAYQPAIEKEVARRKKTHFHRFLAESCSPGHLGTSLFITL